MLYAYIADGALNAGVKVCLTFDVVSPSTGCSGVLSKATQLRCTVQIQVNYCAIIHTDSKWHTKLSKLSKLLETFVSLPNTHCNLVASMC